MVQRCIAATVKKTWSELGLLRKYYIFAIYFLLDHKSEILSIVLIFLGKNNEVKSVNCLIRTLQQSDPLSPSNQVSLTIFYETAIQLELFIHSFIHSFKGDNFSVKISNWIVRIGIQIYNSNMYSALWHMVYIMKKCNL